jgi:hypothetical protein
MKSSANSDNNRSVMKIDPCPSKEALDEPYGDGYFTRVYRTSLVVFAMAALLVCGRGSLPGLIGLSYGAAVSFGSLRAIEMIVRGFFRPGVRWKQRQVAALMVLKLPVLSVALAGAAWLTVQHLANAFALVGGLALVHAVIVLKAVGSVLVSALPEQPAHVSAAWMKAEHWRAKSVERGAWGVESGGLRAERRTKRGLPSPELSTLN